MRSIAIVAVAVLVAGMLARPTPRLALACSGRVDMEEGAYYATLIVLADATDVGDSLNHAPTPGPSSPPRAAGSPAAQRPPEQFALGGIGATLLVVRAYATGVEIGQPLEVDREQREGIERELRARAVGGGLPSTCQLGEFTSRFERGARYLVFARNTRGGSGLFVISRLPVEGDEVVLRDPLAPAGSSPLTYVTATLYHRFFEGIPADVDDAHGFARITADRVALTSVLRAVAFLRADPSISPPDTGNAGLASGRW